MSVKHVSMWKDKKWTRITAEEAARMYKHSVSTHSGLFICDLCQQSVTFIAQGKMSAHFRHSRGEDDKNCDDRIILDKYPVFSSSEHTLPLKLLFDENEIQFLIGFIPFPSNLSGENINAKINISFKSIYGKIGTRHFSYTFERLNKDKITYLSVGSDFTEAYEISVEPAIKGLDKYWPDSIQGINLDGTLFDAKTGKRLPYDADIVLNHKYYLLTDWNGMDSLQGVSIKPVKRYMASTFDAVSIYLVEATEWCESAAKFFIRFHARLTPEAAKLGIVWPRHITYPYIVKYHDNELYLIAEGESVSLQIYPYVEKEEDKTDKGYVYKINPNGQQTSVSIGRTRMLRNIYFWHEDIQRYTEKPSITVTDIMGKEIIEDTLRELPDKKTFIIESPYDGNALITRGNTVLTRYSFQADEKLQIGNLSMDMEINIYIGQDLIRSIGFIKKYIQPQINEEKLLRKIIACHSEEISISHTFGTLAGEIKNYPKVKAWMLKKIHEGKIDKKALSILREEFLLRRESNGSRI